LKLEPVHVRAYRALFDELAVKAPTEQTLRALIGLARDAAGALGGAEAPEVALRKFRLVEQHLGIRPIPIIGPIVPELEPVVRGLEGRLWSVDLLDKLEQDLSRLEEAHERDIRRAAVLKEDLARQRRLRDVLHQYSQMLDALVGNLPEPARVPGNAVTP
jgi:hypothetical protein